MWQQRVCALTLRLKSITWRYLANWVMITVSDEGRRECRVVSTLSPYDLWNQPLPTDRVFNGASCRFRTCTYSKPQVRNPLKNRLDLYRIAVLMPFSVFTFLLVFIGWCGASWISWAAIIGWTTWFSSIEGGKGKQIITFIYNYSTCCMLLLGDSIGCKVKND